MSTYVVIRSQAHEASRVIGEYDKWPHALEAAKKAGAVVTGRPPSTIKSAWFDLRGYEGDENCGVRIERRE